MSVRIPVCSTCVGGQWKDDTSAEVPCCICNGGKMRVSHSWMIDVDNVLAWRSNYTTSEMAGIMEATMRRTKHE